MTNKITREARTASDSRTAALKQAKDFVGQKKEKAEKLASLVRKASSLTEAQYREAVAAMRSVAKTAKAVRLALRNELRANLKTAEAGDEVSDEYADTSETLSQIVNLAETALDQLEDDGGEDTAAAETVAEATGPDGETLPNTAADEEATVDTAAVAEEMDETAAVNEIAAGVKVDSADKTAEATGPDGEVLKKTAGQKRRAEDILTTLVDGLSDLIEQVKDEVQGGDTVDIDENGVVQDDEPPADVVEDTTVTDQPDDEDSIESALAAFFSDEATEAAADVTASGDPYDDNHQPDPLKGLGKAAAANRRTAARGADRDDEILQAIAKSLTR